jgi:hypothetical protein
MTLFACTTYPLVNEDPAKNTPAIYQRDILNCNRAYPENSSGTFIKQRIGCMNLNGWH